MKKRAVLTAAAFLALIPPCSFLMYTVLDRKTYREMRVPSSTSWVAKAAVTNQCEELLPGLRCSEEESLFVNHNASRISLFPFEYEQGGKTYTFELLVDATEESNIFGKRRYVIREISFIDERHSECLAGNNVSGEKLEELVQKIVSLRENEEKKGPETNVAPGP